MEQIIEQIDLEIERLNAVKALLRGDTLLRGFPQERPKKTMSAKARKLIAAAQRKRWAESKKLQREKAA